MGRGWKECGTLASTACAFRAAEQEHMRRHKGQAHTTCATAQQTEFARVLAFEAAVAPAWGRTATASAATTLVGTERQWQERLDQCSCGKSGECVVAAWL